MAKVTEVKFGSSNSNLGNFRIEKFSMFEDADLERYADLRNRANDASSGIKIEMMREYERKNTVREGTGQDLVVTTSEEVILVVQYWEKAPKRAKGDNKDEIFEAQKDWSSERSAG